jgi:hypothetical protein
MPRKNPWYPTRGAPKIDSRTKSLLGLAGLAFLASSTCAATAAEGSLRFDPWDVEQYRTGLVALTRADDRRTAILIFCTQLGTRNVVYAYDGRGQDSREIPISEVRVRAISTIDVFGKLVPSSAAHFDNDGYIIRMQLPLHADFEAPQSGSISLRSGPETDVEYQWSVAVDTSGLKDAMRIAFQNCV